MKSVGEVMAIGRTFKEALLKGLQSLELARPPYPTAEYAAWDGSLESLASPRAERIWAVWEALRASEQPEAISQTTGIDVWFIDQMAQVVEMEHAVATYSAPGDLPDGLLRAAKRAGFGDAHIAWLLAQQQLPPRRPRMASPHAPGPSPLEVRARRSAAKIAPTFHVVDTCAAEFESYTPYFYSSYETESEAPPTKREKVIILGSGPNRIGQGIEFDYCCVHAALALREAGFEAVMVNCNPETVSTDYDTSDRLYFEPLTLEHVLNVVERERPLKGVIVQFGGQTPLNLVDGLSQAGVPILGTSPDAIDIAEDRGRFGALLDELNIPSPANGMAVSVEEAREVARKVEYPVVVRPSYVLGGRAMAVVYDEHALAQYIQAALKAAPGQPVLIDHYIEDAYEVDVDAVADGERVVIGGVMQHIEEAGVHSGDSACVIPPYKISNYHMDHIHDYTTRLGQALGVVGLMNVQYAIKDDTAYVLEVNPRASRTVPYVSKATGVPLAKLATHVIAGRTLDALGFTRPVQVEGFYVKEAVLPFKKFLGVDAILGPEMRSTGEVMGHAPGFGQAFAKAQLAAGDRLPLEGTVLFSVNDFDKSSALKLARDLSRMGFRLLATRGTASFFVGAGLPVEPVNKVSEGSPNVVDFIRAGEVDMVIVTPLGPVAHSDGTKIRTSAVRCNVPLLTTLSAAQAALNGIRALRDRALNVRSLQAASRE
jgi:carbamoyl-phosphate synthase large subunit